MMWLKMGNHSLGTAIDLCDLGLDAIEETDEEFRIGAMVTLRQMETHTGLNAYSRGAIKAAFQDIVGVQFRNGATLGGSLWRRMGFSDIVTAFLAMDSYVELHEGGIVPLERFVNMPYDKDILAQPHRAQEAPRRVRRTRPVRKQFAPTFPRSTCARGEAGTAHTPASSARARPGRAVAFCATTRACSPQGITEAERPQRSPSMPPPASALRGNMRAQRRLPPRARARCSCAAPLLALTEEVR